MAKNKTLYVCSDCGYESAKWMGRCPSCGAWNKMEEQEPAAPVSSAASGPQRKSTVTVPSAPARTLDQIEEGEQERSRCGIAEFDRVLGGGIVPGSLILIGGDPGIGKSTLLLQVSALLAGQGARVLYVSGEESARQIKMRAKRLGVGDSGMYVLSETNMDEIEAQRSVLTPDYMIVDSIQTVYVPGKNAAPGSVSQVREATSILMRAAKQAGTTIFLVGHVTKEGALAGPRVLEHMVDAVLYFEGDRHQEYRILRAAKNRFGSVNEIGVFRMEQAGMEEVPNPSEFLLSGRIPGAAGSAVAVSMEGSRPVLVDLQALVAPTMLSNPRRQALGFDYNRMALLLAVLEKRAGLMLYNRGRLCQRCGRIGAGRARLRSAAGGGGGVVAAQHPHPGGLGADRRDRPDGRGARRGHDGSARFGMRAHGLYPPDRAQGQPARPARAGGRGDPRRIDAL